MSVSNKRESGSARHYFDNYSKLTFGKLISSFSLQSSNTQKPLSLSSWSAETPKKTRRKKASLFLLHFFIQLPHLLEINSSLKKGNILWSFLENFWWKNLVSSRV